MKKYCLIENNSVIKGPEDLPKNFANVSNFYLLDDSLVKDYGWLPYEKDSEEKTVFVSSSFEILEDKVIEHVVTRDETEEEVIQKAEQETAREWENVRRQRDQLLAESDKDIVSDKWEIKSADEKSLWSTYRQALRDIPQTIDSPFNVTWPTKP
jgi:hypothetical protein